MKEREISVHVNREPWTGVIPVSELLYDFLRNRLGLTGTKRSCDQQVCGACTVLVDGQPVSSCTYLAFEIDGCSVQTIEGVGDAGALDPIQDAFVDFGAIQCGFCTPGQVLTVLGFLRERERDPDVDFESWFDGNLCRCGTYPSIREVVRHLVRQGY